MLINATTSVMVQGITGREGSFWTERMLACGTKVVAGVTPGKGGARVHGVPVYDSVTQATASQAIDLSVLFVPPLAARSAVLEAIRAGIKTIVMLTEHIPVHDVMELVAEAKAYGATLIGPNSPGLVVPGQAMVGIMPGWLDNIFKPGHVGVISRSGSLGTLVCLYIVKAGFGQSAFIGIGGDPIIGTRFAEALQYLKDDPNTKAIVMLGEIGGSMEEEAAEVIPQLSKPVLAFIAGSAAPPGRRMGHAGAIVQGNRGTATMKKEVLKNAGVCIATTPSEVGKNLLALPLIDLI